MTPTALTLRHASIADRRLCRLTHHRDIVETGNDSWRFKSRDDDHATRARLVSAIPASSDKTRATVKLLFQFGIELNHALRQYIDAGYA